MDSAMQIFQTSNDISTPEMLAAVISNPHIAKYRDIPEMTRRTWIGTQIYALCLILHFQAPAPIDVDIDAAFADKMIMDDDQLKALTQVEMQEAFRRGIAKEYGDFFGITASALVGFLKAYRNSAKRQKAIDILYKEEQKKISEDRKKEIEAYNKIVEHCIEKGIDLTSLRPGSLSKKIITPEDSEAHRKKIEKQREEILKNGTH